MGVHKGWWIRTEKTTGKARGGVLIPGTNKYRTKTFDTPAEARTWAKGEAACAVTGRPSATLTAGRAMVGLLKDAYLDGLRARGRSASHLGNVTRTLEAIQKVAPDLSAPGAGLAIERWLNGMATGKGQVKPATRNRKMVEARAFCRWAIRRDLLDRDPTRAIESAKVPDFLKPQFTLEELRAILTTEHPFRLRFALMALAGLRVSEAEALAWEDVDLPGRVLYVRKKTKRGKERIVPLQVDLAYLLPAPGAPSARVGVAACDKNDRRAFVRLLTAAGIPVGRRSPHACRHTYAGMMTASGVPGQLLSAYLGHSSAATTMLYTKMASRYVSVAEGWKRGDLQVITGMFSKWQKPEADQAGKQPSTMKG